MSDGHTHHTLRCTGASRWSSGTAFRHCLLRNLVTHLHSSRGCRCEITPSCASHKMAVCGRSREQSHLEAGQLWSNTEGVRRRSILEFCPEIHVICSTLPPKPVTPRGRNNLTWSCPALDGLTRCKLTLPVDLSWVGLFLCCRPKV